MRCSSSALCSSRKPRSTYMTLPLAVDEVGARHALHGVGRGRRAGFVEGDREIRRVLREELVGVGALLVDVDADDHESLAAVLLLHLVHPGKRSPAWAAPRSPEVDVYDLAAKLVQRDRVALGGRQGEYRAPARRPRWRIRCARASARQAPAKIGNLMTMALCPKSCVRQHHSKTGARGRRNSAVRGSLLQRVELVDQYARCGRSCPPAGSGR